MKVRLTNRLRGSNLMAKNAAWSLLGELTRLSSRVVVFLILTYRYEPETYGALVGAMGFLLFLVPVATLGATFLLLQRVAGDEWDSATACRHAFSSVLVGGMLATLALVVLQPVILPQVPLAALLLLALAELVGGGLVEVLTFLAQATERLAAMTAIRAIHAALRLGAALGLFFFSSQPDLWVWAALTAVTALPVIVLGQRVLLGRMVRPATLTRNDVREGLPLSVGFGAESLRHSADSYLLLRLDQPGEAGIYGSASRLTGLAQIPIVALINASNAQIYAAGARSVRECRAVAARVTAGALGISVLIGLVLAVGAELIVAVLPSEYADAADALRWLAVTPALFASAAFAATAVTASRNHRYRIALNVIGSVVNVVLNLMWIPDHGWRGAVAASIVSATIFAAGLWLVLQVLVSRGRR